MKHAAGYTLIELVVAIATASVLMVGLSSALFVSTRALELDDGATLRRSRADQALDRIMTDLAEATRIVSASANEVRFETPDRDGDGLAETLAFTWSGVSGAPLRYEQAGTSAVLLRDVTSLNFDMITRSFTALDVTIDPNPAWPIVEATSMAEVDPKASTLVLPAPAGLVEGEFLIASIATDKDRKDSISPPSGWTEIDLNEESGKVTHGVWWKLASDSEPAAYIWTWSGDEEAIGVALRISNQYPGNPITSYATASGKSKDPECPATGVTLNNSLVIRFGGFSKDKIDTPGDTGLDGYTDVYMNQVSGDVSLGVGYRVQERSGDTGEAYFALTASEEYRTVTVVIAPEQP